MINILIILPFIFHRHSIGLYFKTPFDHTTSRIVASGRKNFNFTISRRTSLSSHRRLFQWASRPYDKSTIVVSEEAANHPPTLRLIVRSGAATFFALTLRLVVRSGRFKTRAAMLRLGGQSMLTPQGGPLSYGRYIIRVSLNTLWSRACLFLYQRKEQNPMHMG